jgi:hypothetical protein
MRLSGQAIRDMYVSNPFVQDAIETALWAGGSAAYQGAFTDMSAEDIAKSTALGALVAMAARPAGGMIGSRIGRVLDKRAPGALDKYAKYIPVTRDGSAAAINYARNEMGMKGEELRMVRDVLKAKRNASSINPDGSPRGVAESALSYYLRNRADNIAQAGVALATPFFMGGEDNA